MSGQLSVPRMTVGCWSFGGGDYWGNQAQDDVDNIVRFAIEAGCGCFDTAEAYNSGLSESALGKALRGIRSKAIICTKVSPVNLHPEMIRTSLRNSLRRLDTDYIDIYLIHWPPNAKSIEHFIRGEKYFSIPPIEPAIEELVKLRERGLIREFGLSNFGPLQIRELADIAVFPAYNQFAYNPLMRNAEFGTFEACESRRISMMTNMPLMQGILTGKYASADSVPVMRARTRHFSGIRPAVRHGEDGFEDLTFKAIRYIRDMAKRESMPMAKLVFRWLASKQSISTIVAGARNARQLENTITFLHSPLGDSLVKEIDRATEELKESLSDSIDYYESLQNRRSW